MYWGLCDYLFRIMCRNKLINLIINFLWSICMILILMNYKDIIKFTVVFYKFAKIVY